MAFNLKTIRKHCYTLKTYSNAKINGQYEILGYRQHVGFETMEMLDLN